MHSRHRYLGTDVVWGGRHVDILSELPSGEIQMDVRKFHLVMPTVPTATFPYPRA